MFRLSRVGWFSLACVQNPPPLPSVKIGEGAPFSDFYWGEGRRGGGGVCTQARFSRSLTVSLALLYLKKITLRLPGEKVWSSQIQHTFSVFSVSEALIYISQPANGNMFYFPARSNSAWRASILSERLRWVLFPKSFLRQFYLPITCLCTCIHM